MSYVTVENLSFAYAKGIPVLQNISFSIAQGEYICLLGPNGVGKSTLFGCMLGLNSKYHGTISVDNKDIRKLNERQLARKIAYIPQSSVHTFNYTVEDVVLMGTTSLARGFGSPKKKEEQLALEALNKIDIIHLRNRNYQNISGGERQLVLIARALAQNTKILFMDEPTANLDYGNQCRILEEIRLLIDDGYTVIQSTHNPDQAFLYADRVLAIKDGKVAAYGAPDEVLNEELMRSLYGVDIAIKNIQGDTIRICVPKSVLRAGEEAPKQQAPKRT